MRIPPTLLLLCLAAAPLPAEAPPLSPATLIADAATDPVWHPLFAQLAPRREQQSFFEERRYFPFRKVPWIRSICQPPERG